MAWAGIVGIGMTLDKLKVYIDGLVFKWRPSLIVLHNTGAPTGAQWAATAVKDIQQGLVPGTTRIRNLETYFRDQQHWPSAPHAFVAPDLVWPFTPFNVKGTHAPSWNGVSIGIEMVADFSREDDDSGDGLKVRRNTVALVGMLCEKLGLDPQTCIRLHKEDPKTTHKDCPGIDFARDRQQVIDEVYEYMGHGGDLGPPEPEPNVRLGTTHTPGDTLNVREGSTVSSKILFTLNSGSGVVILGEAQNGSTRWLRVSTNNRIGWVSARYVREV